MKPLSPLSLNGEQRALHKAVQSAPTTILQIGEGNFLRGFFDWMIQQCIKQGLFHGSIAVVQPRPSGKANIEKLMEQQGIYTLVTQGIRMGRAVMEREIISVFSNIFDPYEDWNRLTALAVLPSLQFVVSNTTEAGIAYTAEPLQEGPIASFPGKLAHLLYLRYQAFDGCPERGLTFLPCELLERNGDALKQTILRHAADWELPAAFKDWVMKHNVFLNTLVDRIVTGYPDAKQAQAWFHKWGYTDQLLCTTEPYYLWVIEAKADMEMRLPLQQAGLHVLWTDDLRPYQTRKVRILNGAHTWMAPLGLLHGIDDVRSFLMDEEWWTALREVVFKELIPTVSGNVDSLQLYAEQVLERFANPFLCHQLHDIAMNSLSKARVRLLPSIVHYLDQGKTVPPQLVLGFAALLRYYKVEKHEDGSYTGMSLHGKSYSVRDDAELLERMSTLWKQASTDSAQHLDTIHAILSEERFWGRAMCDSPSFAANLAEWLQYWERGISQ